ncbi:hypothetical protein CASFOL_041005 [Castilleja foliolosa]|uniref:Uncharacterized protein n=1 Tax=Castilleja foliolosa TaxID=1961234 RepID=A0ABD3BDM0_9LAMI
MIFSSGPTTQTIPSAMHFSSSADNDYVRLANITFSSGAHYHKFGFCRQSTPPPIRTPTLGFNTATSTYLSSRVKTVKCPIMTLKLLKDITYPDFPQMIEARVRNITYSETQIPSPSKGYAVDVLAHSSEETDLDKMITLIRTYAPVVPHPTSIRTRSRTHFQLVINETIPAYCFNFVPIEKLEERLDKGSPLSEFGGHAESTTEMIATREKKTGNTLYLRRIVIMDDRASTIEVTFWEDKAVQ